MDRYSPVSASQVATGTYFFDLASMGIDPDYSDTLMHISGHLLRDNVAAQVKPFRRIQVIRPAGKAD